MDKEELKQEEYLEAKKDCKTMITKVIKVWNAREETIHDVSFKHGYESGLKVKEKRIAELEEVINDCVRELQNILYFKIRNKERIASVLDKAEQFLSEVEK